MTASGLLPYASQFLVVLARALGAAHRLPAFGSRLPAATAARFALALGVAGAAGGVAWLVWSHPGTSSERVDFTPDPSGRC